MLNTFFQGVFDTNGSVVIPVTDFLLCVGVSLAIGGFLAAVYMYKNRYTQSFVMTLALIPAVVCVVIMMVNGNIGAGVAVTGAFSLVRFRSVPGTAKEICAIFLAMGAGLITGMGYLGYGILFSVILGIVNLLYIQLGIWSDKKHEKEKILRITVPENLDYTDAFDDLMEEYTIYSEITNVKTSDMGSLFKLTYNIILKNAEKEKEFIDKLRCRNGNLEINLSRQEITGNEL